MSNHNEIKQQRSDVEHDKKGAATKRSVSRKLQHRVQRVHNRTQTQTTSQCQPTNTNFDHSLLQSRSKTQTLMQQSENQTAGSKLKCRNFTTQTDPAIIIGLVMSFGRQGGLANVPDVLLVSLCQSAMKQCGASTAVLKWLERQT